MTEYNKWYDRSPPTVEQVPDDCPAWRQNSEGQIWFCGGLAMRQTWSRDSVAWQISLTKPEPYVKPEPKRRTGFLYGTGTPNDHPQAIQTYPGDPDFDLLINKCKLTAQELKRMSDTNSDSSVSSFCYAWAEVLEKALRPEQ